MRAFDDLRRIEHLARTLHFGRSSAECHVSQPTLSRAVARVEQEVGVQLFHRDRRSVALTPEGVRFRAFAIAVLDAWRAYEERDDAGEEVVGTISLFCTVTAAQSIVPGMLAAFRQLHPAVHLDLHTGDAVEALDQLEAGAVDVAIAALPPRPPKHLVTSVLSTTALVFVAPVGGPHRLTPKPSRSWGSVPFVLPEAGLVRSVVDAWFRRHRIRPQVMGEAAGHEAVLTLVALGCGVGVVPEMVAAASPPSAGIEVLPLSVPPATFDIAACTTTERLASPAVSALWRSLAPGATA